MREIADFALLVLWRSGLVAGAALLAAPALRRRHALLVCALIACAIVPFWTAAAPPPLLHPEPRAVAQQSNTIPNTIATLYLLALAHSAASLLLAWRASRKLRANTTHPPAAALAALETCARAFGVTATLRCSPRVRVPMTVGSTILLPREPLPEDALLPVIAHELAHVRRRDVLLHVLLKIITLPIAFHPLVRMLERRVAVAREIACDALVTSTLVEPQTYARTLLSIAERGIAPRYAMAFGDAEALEMRLLSLRNSGSSRKWIGAAIVIALVAFGASQLPLHVFGRRPDLTGTWILDRAASGFPYDAFTARIVQTPASVATWQTRVRRGRTMRVHFQVFTDGVTRNLRIAGMEGRGSARWSGSHLISEFSTPQGHHEETHVWLDDPNTLIVQASGQTGKHVFRRSE
jgi:hypothetical protein